MPRNAPASGTGGAAKVGDVEPPVRHARPDDAEALAELMDMAGEGLPQFIWRKAAGAGQSPMDVGRARARTDRPGFSWRNAVGIEHDGRLAACLIGWVTTPPPGERNASPSIPALAPLGELEALAPGTFYVNALAVFPEFRGLGWGSRLLVEAERHAADADCPGLSLIVADSNGIARRLYERNGFVETASRPMIKDGWQHPGRTWLLMTKSIRSADHGHRTKAGSTIES